MLETIESGKPETSFLKFGDTVRIDMRLPDGNPLFGAISQRVSRHGA
jgi:fumarylacetoacetate (FAA) hydrolase